MHILRVVMLAVTILLFVIGIVAGQERTADDISCALWLQWAEKAKRFTPGSLYTLPSTELEMKEFVSGLAEAFELRGVRKGYAIGVFATSPRGPRSHIRDSDEFITALDALCAGAPHKKLIDVALHALGRR